jgi:hypothetical protein
MPKRTRNYLTMLAVAALSAGSAVAATQYTTFASWSAALAGGPVEALPFAQQSLINPTLFVNGFGTFLGDGTALATTITYPGHTTDSLQEANLTVTAPAGGTKAAMLWLGANQTGVNSVTQQPLTITLTDVNNTALNFTLTTGASAPSFWGFTAGTAINTITIAAPAGYQVDLMDFYAGTFTGTDVADTPTPEGSTMFLLGGGLILLGTKRKFRPASEK